MRLSKFEQTIFPLSRLIEFPFRPPFLFLLRTLAFGFLQSCFHVPKNVPAGVTAGDDEEFPAPLRPWREPVHRLKVAWHASFRPCIPQNSWTALTTGWSYRCGSPVRLGMMISRRIRALEVYVRRRGIYGCTVLIPCNQH